MQDGTVIHGRPGSSKFTWSGTIVTRRLVLAGARGGGLRGRVWIGHPEPGQPGQAGPDHQGDVPDAPPEGHGT
jgi:hypothetical protein